MALSLHPPIEGFLPIHKEENRTSFSLITLVRKITGVKKIGHSGTLDPFASGVMILLIGRNFTKKCSYFTLQEKEYRAKICLGVTTNTYDREGIPTHHHPLIPTLEQIRDVLSFFQGDIEQIPPMFCAKKVQGKKLYHLARKGVEIARKPIRIHLTTTLLSYSYPYLDLLIQCSSGTYIRSLAHDVGQKLGCGAFLFALQRTKVGTITLQDCIEEATISTPQFILNHWIRRDANL